MRQVIATVGALLLGVFLLLTGAGLLGTLLGVRAVLAEFPTPVIGAVMAAFHIGLMAGSVYARPIIRRVGHIRAFAAFVSIISVTPLLHGIFVDPIAWGLVRVLYGFAFAAIYTITESWLNTRAPDEMRGQVFSVYMITTYVSVGAGQFLLQIYPAESFELLALVAVFFSVAVIPVALTRSAAPEIQDSGALSLRALYRESPLGLVGSFTSGLASGAIFGMTAVFGQGIGLDVAHIALLMASFIFGGLIVQWPIGRLSDIIDRRKVMTGTAILGAAVAIVPFVIPDMPPWLLYVAAGFYGGLAFSLYSLAVAHANDMARGQGLMEISAGLVLVWGAGAAAGPIIASGVMEGIGYWGLFLYLSVILVLLAAFALFRMTRRPAVPVEEQAPYVAMPRTTPEAVHLDPRYDESQEDAPMVAEAAAAETPPPDAKP